MQPHSIRPHRNCLVVEGSQDMCRLGYVCFSVLCLFLCVVVGILSVALSYSYGGTVALVELQSQYIRPHRHCLDAGWLGRWVVSMLCFFFSVLCCCCVSFVCLPDVLCRVFVLFTRCGTGVLVVFFFSVPLYLAIQKLFGWLASHALIWLSSTVCWVCCFLFPYFSVPFLGSWHLQFLPIAHCCRLSLIFPPGFQPFFCRLIRGSFVGNVVCLLSRLLSLFPLFLRFGSGFECHGFHADTLSVCHTVYLGEQGMCE